MPLRVLIVDDHPVLAHVIATVLRANQPDLDIVLADSAIAASAQMAGAWSHVFLEPAVSDAAGPSLARAVDNAGLTERCCIVTAIHDPRLIAQARHSGMRGFIDKRCSLPDFCRSLQAVLGGERVFPPTPEPPDHPHRLSARQLDVLRLLHRGLSSKQIAHRLHLAEGTVKNHTLAVLRALDATNRAHAVARAMELRLLDA
jgi:DNA-binding NarL/FixJ family response regulator